MTLHDRREWHEVPLTSVVAVRRKRAVTFEADFKAVNVFSPKRGHLNETSQALESGSSFRFMIPLSRFLLQTYILRIEVVLCGVALALQGVQAIFSFICLVSFYSSGY